MRESYHCCGMCGAEDVKSLAKSLKEAQRLTIDFGDVLQFHEVQPPFTGLTF